MIFVTVGNSTDGFRRLLDAVDRLAQEGCFENDYVLIQTGHNKDFQPLNCMQQAFFAIEEFAAMIHEATLVICHGGAGTLLHVLQAGKIPVVMPRRKQYGEVVDDHQLELVQALTSEGRIVPAFEPIDLPSAIIRARHFGSGPVRHPASPMQSVVSRAIIELIG